MQVRPQALNARQFATFAAVGIVGTLIHYGVLMTLIGKIGMGIVAASSIGFLAGAVANYVMNYRVTFRSSRSHRIALPRFLAIAVVGFTVNLLLMARLPNLIDLHFMLIQIGVSIIVLLIGYTLNALWTFGDQATR